MPSPRQIPRVHTSEIKLLILNKLGRKKAESYFFLLKKLLSLKITKLEFDKLCCGTIGKENVALHNLLIRTILKNACASHSVLDKETLTGFSRNSKVSNSFSNDALVASSCRRVSVAGSDRQFKDRRSPLGREGKVHNEGNNEISNPCDPQRPQELISIGSKAFVEVVSVEDGEEVEQVRGSPGVQSRSPVTAPFGIPMRTGDFTWNVSKKRFGSAPHLSHPGEYETCHQKCELPDTKELKNRMEHNLEQAGLTVSVGSADVLNNALDLYLKRMIKPCVELVRARYNSGSLHLSSASAGPDTQAAWQKQHLQMPNNSSTSIHDFRVAVESNPLLLGQNGFLWLEKILLRSMDVL